MRAKLRLYLLGLRERQRTIRTFFRFPLRLQIAVPAGARTARVLIYGIPFADWNAALADRAMWEKVPGVARVLRLPGLPILATLISRSTGERRIVIPTRTAHAARLPRGWHSLSPNDASIHAFGDKRRFAAYMQANGFGDYCPATYLDPADAVFPCVLKRVNKSGSWGIVVVHSRAELETQLQTALFRNWPHTLQALVADRTEHATYCVCKGGAVLWHCTFLTEVDRPDVIKAEGNVVRRWTIATPEPIVRQIERVLAPLAYTGPCNVDYKLGSDGKIRIFEINPRLGGSLMMPQHREELRQALACIVDNAAVGRLPA